MRLTGLVLLVLFVSALATFAEQIEIKSQDKLGAIFYTTISIKNGILNEIDMKGGPYIMTVQKRENIISINRKWVNKQMYQPNANEPKSGRQGTVTIEKNWLSYIGNLETLDGSTYLLKTFETGPVFASRDGYTIGLDDSGELTQQLRDSKFIYRKNEMINYYMGKPIAKYVYNKIGNVIQVKSSFAMGDDWVGQGGVTITVTGDRDPKQSTRLYQALNYQILGFAGIGLELLPVIFGQI